MVEALLEYIKIGLAVTDVRSMTTVFPVVVETTCVPTFPAMSIKSILKLTVPEGSLGTTALDWADQPIRFVTTPVVASMDTGLPKMVMSEVVICMFSLAVISSSMVLPSLANC